MNAHEYNGRHRTLYARLIGGDNIYVLGPYHRVDLFILAEALIDARKNIAAHTHLVIVEHQRGHNVALAYEIRHKRILRFVIYIRRRSYLLYHAVAHYDYGIAHRKRLLLIVRDVYERDAELLLHTLKLNLHLLAQLKIERAERFVKKQHLWLVNERARYRHALLLPAGKLVYVSFAVALQVNKLQHFLNTPRYVRLGRLFYFQAERNVVEHVEMRKKRIFLEHGVYLALMRRNAAHILARHNYLAGRRHGKARDYPQQRCFAAARRPEKRQELAVAHIERNVVERQLAVKFLRYVFQLD